ncbi:AHL acylase [Truncatella angustata]|uniref:AHL acylase n=1 Tax=Truncatella angustata TaxID=152316 RepID=A0A9P9A0K0_9PEZI|nr:AHL acylase [Truncatella angustata]KAH6658472.1 AHL acylase [Truncatella angustata]KAH8195386.1 hypothetical protein TruAng_010443 [Truncatella angustata]
MSNPSEPRPAPTLVETSYGRVAYRSFGSGSLPPVFCIHGNSSSRHIFKPVLLNQNITSTRRVIAVDLPGHGESDDAKDPAHTYTMPAYAKACVEVLNKLDISEVVLVGWSLGGHIAVEILPLFSGVKGIVIVGSLLVPIWGKPLDDERTRWNMREDLSDEELTAFSKRATGGPWEQWMAESAIRTDSKARRVLFTNLGCGDCSDQQKLAAETNVPLAVVVGTDEPHLDNNKIKGLKYGNLWSGKVIEIQNGKHCPVWEKPADFNPVLEKFLGDVAA